MSPSLGPLDELLEAAVRDGVTPGAAAAVLSRGRLVHESWHGFAALEPERRTLVRGDLFDVASLTKVLCTTTLAALLVDDGLLALDEPLAARLPELDRPGTVAITPRELLAHTSGLVAWRPYFEAITDDPQAAALLDPRRDRLALGPAFARARTIVREAILAEQPELPVGSRAVYSDPGFIILGWLIEALTGTTLDRLFHERVAAPLGLGSTLFVPEHDPARALSMRTSRRFVATEASAFRREVVCGAVHDENAWALGGIAGHAGLFSTPRETAAVGELWLEAAHGRRGLLTPVTACHFLERQGPPPSTRALGWDTPEPASSSAGSLLGKGPRGAFGHLGFTGTSLWIDLDRELVVVLLTNRVHPSRTREGIKALRPAFHDAVVRALTRRA